MGADLREFIELNELDFAPAPESEMAAHKAALEGLAYAGRDGARPRTWFKVGKACSWDEI